MVDKFVLPDDLVFDGVGELAEESEARVNAIVWPGFETGAKSSGGKDADWAAWLWRQVTALGGDCIGAVTDAEADAWPIEGPTWYERNHETLVQSGAPWSCLALNMLRLADCVLRNPDEARTFNEWCLEVNDFKFSADSDLMAVAEFFAADVDIYDESRTLTFDRDVLRCICVLLSRTLERLPEIPYPEDDEAEPTTVYMN